jgi:hypothetical protein
MWGPYLTRGRVCSFQLFLGLTSTVFLGCESRRTHDHILLSKIRDSIWQLFIVIHFVHGPNRKHRFQQSSCRLRDCYGNYLETALFTTPLLSNSRSTAAYFNVVAH